MYVAPVTPKILVRLYLQLYNQIAGHRACVPLFGDSKVNTSIDPFWNVHGLFDSAVRSAFATARYAGSFDYYACAVAHPTHLLHHKRTLLNCLEASAAAATAFLS